jgi:acetyltransferase-like isoleucine patch superfamily enzyme
MPRTLCEQKRSAMRPERRITIANVLLFIEFKSNYLKWCMRFPRMLAHRCNIGSRSRLFVGPNAEISFGEDVYFTRNFTGDFYGRLTIGRGVFFQHSCTMSVHENVTIGEYALFGEQVSITDANHVITAGSDPIDFRGFVTRPIVIGRNVWVGAKATILPGVHIGDNAVIGANAVVTHDIPAYTVAVGIPARVIRDMRPTDLHDGFNDSALPSVDPEPAKDTDRTGEYGRDRTPPNAIHD